MCYCNYAVFCISESNVKFEKIFYLILYYSNGCWSYDLKGNVLQNYATVHVCKHIVVDYNYCKFCNSIHYKDPLLFNKFSVSISNETWNWNFAVHISLDENKVKDRLSEIHAPSNLLKWQTYNFKIDNINGLRKSKQIANSNIWKYEL